MKGPISCDNEFIPIMYQDGKGLGRLEIFSTTFYHDIKVRKYVDGQFAGQFFLPKDPALLTALHRELLAAASPSRSRDLGAPRVVRVGGA